MAQRNKLDDIGCPVFETLPLKQLVSSSLDHGMVLMMIEYYRTALIWKLMRACPYISTGLRRAVFRGSWQ